MCRRNAEEIRLSIDNFLVLAKLCLKNSKFDEAKVHCAALLELDSTNVDALRLYATICGINGDLDEAIQIIGKAISFSAAGEPSDYFSRGRWCLRDGRLDGAINNFKEVIEICKKNNDEYYVEDAYLHMAIAFFYQGEKERIISALAHVGDDCRTSINGTVFSKKYITQAISV